MYKRYCLETGPPLHNSIVDILIRFRLHTIAIVTDIEKAFHQINIDASQRDLFRFFWLTDINDPNSSFKVFRFKVLPFGANCSPFILNLVLQHHLRKLESKTNEKLLQDTYVDNIITGINTFEEALNFYEEANETMSKASFNLKYWNTNHPELNKIFKRRIMEATTVKILGYLWCEDTDKLKLNETKYEVDRVTKRKILKGLASFFDPLGLFAPITVKPKLLIQALWKEGKAWDEPVNNDQLQKWNEVISDLSMISTLTIERCIQAKTSYIYLQVFVDASKVALGAVAYLTNREKSSLIFSKTRVAPLKPRTIPQLELSAALLGTEVAEIAKRALLAENYPNLSIQMWSDSLVVLCWLQRGQPKTIFAKNRIQKILAFIDKYEATWKYCPTEDNPADLLTRETNFPSFSNNPIWSEGPIWIKDSQYWPNWSPTHIKLEEPEIVSNYVHHTSYQSLQVKNHGNLLEIIDVKRFSSLKKLIQTIVYVKRFVDIKCKRIKNNNEIIDNDDFLTAKHRLIKSVQLKEFKAELFYLKTKRGSRPSLVKQLDLFLDNDEIIRCKGRLQHAEVKYGAKFPVLLPKYNEFTRLVIKQAHEEVLHSGMNATVAAIFQNYWIPSTKQQVKSFIKGCVICRRTHGPTYFVPDSPPLPKFRATGLHPFEVTGVDFAGPFLVKKHKHVVNIYIALFTCASSRAIHLELVEDLSGQAFLEAFKRFTNRRSIPGMVISDNATNFEFAAKTIRNLMKDTINYAMTKEIKWKFIPKRAPWFGGFWERLIGLTKNAL